MAVQRQASLFLEAPQSSDEVAQAPLIRFVGSKRWLAPLLARGLRRKLQQTPGSRYVEPFFGGGAVGLQLGWPATVAGDLSPHLVALYCAVQQDAAGVARELQRVAETYGGRDTSTAPGAGYYGARVEFNGVVEGDAGRALARRAALLLYLVARGFNGVFRTNACGAWNVPEGDVARPAFVTRERLEAFGRAVAGWTFSCVDFQPVVDGARFGDSIFADPPYADLPEGVQRTPIFTGYTPGGYGAHDQVRLADALTRARGRGCVVVHTNSASPKIQDLYRERGFITLPTAELRAVSRDASTRSRRGCLLVVSHPEVVA